MWEEIVDDKEVNIARLEELFCDPRANKSAKKESAAPKKKKEEAVHLIDGKRTQNVSIGLGRVRMTNDELRACLVKLDETLLNPGNTEVGGMERARVLVMECMPLTPPKRHTL